MIDEKQAIVDDLLIRLAEIEATRSKWEPKFDVHFRDLDGKANQVIATQASDAEQIVAILRDTVGSFRAVADTHVSVACWLYLNSCDAIRRLLIKTLAPWGGLVVLLANLSGRLFIRFESTGDVRWARFALVAIALLGDNADVREDLAFVRRVSTALVNHGYDAASIFRDFSKISIGRAQSLFCAEIK